MPLEWGHIFLQSKPVGALARATQHTHYQRVSFSVPALWTLVQFVLHQNYSVHVILRKSPLAKGILDATSLSLCHMRREGERRRERKLSNKRKKARRKEGKKERERKKREWKETSKQERKEGKDKARKESKQIKRRKYSHNPPAFSLGDLQSAGTVLLQPFFSIGISAVLWARKQR